MKLNNKTLRQLRRALRREATYLVKFRKKILDGGLEDHRRWKSWVRGTPPAVRQLLAAAEVWHALQEEAAFACALSQCAIGPASTRDPITTEAAALPGDGLQKRKDQEESCRT